MMLFCRSCVRASITDDALVVRVTGDAPRLWRAPLSEIANATLAIDTKVEGAKTFYRLMINKTGGVDEIARFGDAKAAERAFIAVSDRLLDGQQGVRHSKRPLIVRLLIAFGKVLLWFLFLFMIAVIAAQFFLKSRGIDTSLGTTPAPTQAEAPAAPAAPADGVAVPADQLFGQ